MAPTFSKLATKPKAHKVSGEACKKAKKVVYSVGCNHKFCRLTFVEGASPAKAAKSPDPRVHRFGRERGFNTVCNNLDNFSMEVIEDINSMTHKPKSEDDRVKNQAKFENFILECLPASPYAEFLRKLENLNSGEPMEILKPSHHEVNA